MILRVWRGWTATAENADAYEAFLRDEMFPRIHGQRIQGFHGISLSRFDGADEIEFMTIMRFDSIEAIQSFAGERYQDAVVLPKARAVLSRFDAQSRHYEVRIPEEQIS